MGSSTQAPLYPLYFVTLFIGQLFIDPLFPSLQSLWNWGYVTWKTTLHLLSNNVQLVNHCLYSMSSIYCLFQPPIRMEYSSAAKRNVVIGYKCSIAHAQRYTPGAIYDVAL